MKKGVQIFKRDTRRILRNKVAAIVMMGVCIIPSLYAWFNIGANMDPYSNTGRIKVAVANADKGVVSETTGELHTGAEVEKKLRKNHDLGWCFVDEKAAKEGVKSGEYYAAIVIPENFSKSLVSVLSGEITSPEVEYYVNEKKNAIAPKITDTGAGSLQTQIDQEFTSIVTETVSDMIKEKGTEIFSGIESANKKIQNSITDVEKNLAAYQDAASQLTTSAEKGAELIETAQNTLSDLKSASETGGRALQSAEKVQKDSRTAIQKFSLSLSAALSNGESALSTEYSQIANRLTDLEGKAGAAGEKLDVGLSGVQHVADLNGEILEELKKIDTELPLLDCSDLIAQMEDTHEKNKKLLETLSLGNSSIQASIQTASEARQKMEAAVQEGQEGIQESKNRFENKIMGNANQLLDSASGIGGNLQGILSGIPALSDQTNQILSQVSTNLTNAKTAVSATGKALDSLQTSLTDAQNELKALESSQTLEQLLNLNHLDAEEAAGFMKSPVEIRTEVLYPVKNYGSAMTPFYTNLAIWVGGIVLIAILKLEADRDSYIKEFTPTDGFFGRWMLFAAAGLIQALIVCAGDILLLKVQCKHPVLFVLTGMICSFVYVNLIYALSITFKHIGKALCVLLVILQIPGSSGTYPIEMTPAFFRGIHPFLPFTYGINAMREAMAGVYIQNYLKDIGILLLFFPIALVIGLFIRPALLNVNAMFDERLAETEIMICEEYPMKRKAGLSTILHAMLRHEEWSKEVEDRAERFRKGYRKRVRLGFLAMILIPLIFLLLMFRIQSKMVFLILWILSVVLISGYLIINEYIYHKLEQEKQLRSLSKEELEAMFREREAGKS